MIDFDLTQPLPSGRVVLEASAGTGKTYALTALVVRYLAETATPVDQLLVVTFTRAAANELRDRTRSVLDAAIRALRHGTPPNAHPWMSVLFDTSGGDGSGPAGDAIELRRRERRLVEAVSRFDDLPITTIHGFCQQTLGQLGVRAGQNPDAVLVESTTDVVDEVCRDVIVTALADDPHLLDAPKSATVAITSPQQAENELKAAVTTLVNNPGATLAPVDPADPKAARWVELVLAAHEQIAQRQVLRNEIGYDALIAGVQRALADPQHGPAVAAQLAQRSSVVLVDEFQDTDRLQWDVFDRAFSQRTLITVGDPKQAIYRFRGADVHAYLDAVHAADARGLGVNHRSDAAVLDGVAQLLAGATLGDQRIPFRAVAAAPGARRSSLRTAGASGDVDTHADEPAVVLRAVPLAESLRPVARRSSLSMPLVRSLVLDDLVARTVELLDHGRLIGDDESARRVEPGDIAVLVPSHADAENVASALRRAHVPAVRTRTGSVLVAPAATQWRLLLAALAQPHQTPLVRAAALGWFLRTDVASIADDDNVLADLQARTASLADRMRAVGVAAFYDEQKGGAHVSGGSLIDTVLGRTGGERHLTDLDHIAELLAAALLGHPSDPAQVLRTLEQMIRDTDERNEAVMRRIDSDARAVQITTIHGAKGLEYPIVLLPFAFKQRASARTPFTYTRGDGRRTIDLASKVTWVSDDLLGDGDATRDVQVVRRQLAIDDIEGDELRLLYVALTRAEHHVEVWWASTLGAGTSALARVLTDRFGAGDVQNTQAVCRINRNGNVTVDKPAFQNTTDVNALAQIRMLVDHSDGALGLIELPDRIDPPEWSGRAAPSILPMRIADTAGTTVGDQRWTRWSFSRLSAAVEIDTVARRDVDERGGLDEPDEPAGDDTDASDALDGASTTGAAGSVAEQLQLGVGPVAHLADVAGGTRFGTFVHAVLEHLDCTLPDLPTEVRSLVVEHAAREGLELDTDPTGRGANTTDIVAGIVAAVRTPLGPAFGGRSLADIAPHDRLAELVFDIPVVGAAGRFSAGAIGDVLLRHLDRRDAMRPFAKQLAAEFADFDIAGWMHGSIDAVLRVPAEHTHRYIVIDYKTNRLHTPGAVDPVGAYHPRHLVPAMEHSRYPLQALLYTVAVHRYLRWRLGNAYAPDVHLGGIAYLFVRGMVGPSTPLADGVPHGVFSWRPSTSAVLALDQLFATGAVS
ncbi:MAG: Exodeoxyribonuclease [Ilumatobacteraceae bacterium]|nr:Exodeoxyribonuclease [Ilumatobacteraceae bacterium]